MIAIIYGIGLIMDLNSGDIGSRLTLLFLALVVFIIKSIWAAVENPFFVDKSVNRLLIVVAIIVKIVIVISLGVTLVRRDEIAALKVETFGEEEGKSGLESEVEPRADIWSEVA